MTTEAQNEMLSPSDVADLAGVGRSVVSNWRKRPTGFPDPIAGTEAKPLFARKAILDWLHQRGHQVVDESAGARIWSALNAIRDRITAEDAVDFALYLAVAKIAPEVDFEAIAAKHPADQADALTAVLGDIRSLPGLAEVSAPSSAVLNLQPSISLIVHAIDRTNVDELPQAVDFVLDRLSRRQIKGGAEHGFVGSRTSKVLASLVGDGATTLLDPACGIANVLTDAASPGSPIRLVGSDINTAALTIAAQRAYLRGLNLELHQADVLSTDPTPDLIADVVVAEPPFGLQWDPTSRLADPRFTFGVPPRRSADLAWIQHALAHVAPGGRAYVLTLPGALFHTGAEAQIRTNLLLAGCIRAIVSLPPKMLPHTSIGPTLWVLQPPTEVAEVLLIDGSSVDEIEVKIAAWIHDDDIDDDIPHARVAIAELLAAGAVLTPSRWVASIAIDADEVAADFAEAVGALRTTINELGQASLQFDGLGDIPKPRLVTIRELIDNGAVEFRPGRHDKNRNEDFADAVIRAQDVKAQNLPVTRVSASEFRPGEVTEPGDVLVTTMNDVHAVIDVSGGHLCSMGVDRLRVLDHAVLNPAYLAGVLTGSWNARHQMGSTIQRAPIRDLEVPLIPPPDQTAVANAWEGLRQLRDQAAALRTQVDRAQDAVLNAVRYEVSLGTGESVSPTGHHGRDSKDDK